jgi:uncharacterized membrane protein YgaE (UPF0421/DUF939 family)
MVILIHGFVGVITSYIGNLFFFKKKKEVENIDMR